MPKQILAIVCAASAALATGCAEQPRTAIEHLLESRRLAAELLLQLAKTNDAGNRAVMADSDEAAAVATREAETATAAVQKDAAVLADVLSRLGYKTESAMLDEFRQRFAEFRDLDRTILDLAALDTNVKAQRLSFGQAQDAANGIRDALSVVAARPAADRWQVRALAAEVMTSVREIQALQAPHIQEADDAAMTRLEGRMKAAETSARDGLSALAKVVQPESRTSVSAASAKVDQFLSIHSEILKLSRQNSNVRSLALSLGRKRTLAASCEERLRAIQDALAKRDIGPTR